MRLKYEQSSEPLHISAKWLFFHGMGETPSRTMRMPSIRRLATRANFANLWSTGVISVVINWEADKV